MSDTELLASVSLSSKNNSNSNNENDNCSHPHSTITDYPSNLSSTLNLSSGRLIPATKSRPCPICERISYCKHSDRGGVLCASYSDAKLFDIINGWKCTKIAGNTDWSTWVFDNGSHRSQQEYKPIKKAEKPKENQKNNFSPLSAIERDAKYANLFSEMSVLPSTRADLISRRFTDEDIPFSGIKSINPWQVFKGDYQGLPGIKDGNQLSINYEGYVLPVRDYDGLLVAFQVRLLNQKDIDEVGTKYLWSKGKFSAHIEINGCYELPLAVFKPKGTPIGIAFVEGTGLKCFYVAQRLGYLVIGAAGGQWASSPNQLREYIDRAKKDYGDLPITIFPDANWCLDKCVRGKIETVIDLLSENPNNNVLVADWNQITKKQPDVDELPKGFNIRYLKLDAWLKKYKEVFRKYFNGESSKAFINWATSRKALKADIIQNEEWVSIPENIHEQCDIFTIRGALATGKTEALIRHLKSLNIDATFLIGYRNSLIIQTISRANKAGLSATHIKDTSENIGGINVDFGQDDSIKLFGACVDSHEKLDTVMAIKENYGVAIDEICSVLQHLKNGGTLKKKQQAAIDWVVSSISNTKFTILMDANISDTEVELLRKLFPNKKIKVLDSVSKPKPKVFNFLETSKDGDFEEYSSNPKHLTANLATIAQQQEKVLWLSDSQRSCEMADELAGKQGLKSFRLDGKTSAEDISRIFLNDPDEFIKSEKIDSLMLSPSAESGLSITLEGYFDVVCLDIKGVLNVNSLTQIAARLRDVKVPIYVSCPEFVNFEKVKNPYRASEEFNKAYTARLTAFQSQTDNFYGDANDHKTLLDEACNDLKKKIETDHLFLSSLQDNQRDIYEKNNLRLCLKTALCQDGHIVKDWVEESDTVSHAEVQDAKDFVIRREANKIFNSVDIDIEQANKLDQSEQKYEVKCQVKKAKIKEQVSGIEETKSWNSEFIEALIKKSNFLNAQWNLQQLKNPELSESLFRLQNKNRLLDLNFNFSPGEIWNNRTTKIDALRELGILEYIEAEKFSTAKKSKYGLNATKIVEKYYADDRLYRLIGIKKAPINKTYIATMFKKLIGYFGLEMKQVSKNDGEKFYACVTPKDFEPYISDINTCYLKRSEQLIDEAKKLQIVSSIDFDKISSMVVDAMWNEPEKPENVSAILNPLEFSERQKIYSIIEISEEMISKCESDLREYKKLVAIQNVVNSVNAVQVLSDEDEIALIDF